MEIRKKLQLFRYYMNANSNSPISIIGIMLDVLFLDLLTWIFVYLWIVYRTKSPLISILLSTAFVILLDIAIYIKKYRTYIINRKKRRRESVVSHLSNRISHLNNQEFQLQLIKLLLNCKGFSNIHKDEGFLKADYNDTPVAIGFHHPPPGGKTPFTEVWGFVHQTRSLGFEQGFFFTSSSFEDDCNLQKVSSLGFTLHLMDADCIIDIMEEGGMFPDERTIDQLILGEMRKEKTKKQKIKQDVFSPVKARQFLFFSIIFLLASLLFNRLRLYYLVVSLLFAALALLIKLAAPNHPGKSEEPLQLTDDNPRDLA